MREGNKRSRGEGQMSGGMNEIHHGSKSLRGTRVIEIHHERAAKVRDVIRRL